MRGAAMAAIALVFLCSACARPIDCGPRFVYDEASGRCVCPSATMAVGAMCVPSDASVPQDAAPSWPGRWEGCESALTFSEDGGLVYESFAARCVATGAWRVRLARLELSFDASAGCPELAGTVIRGAPTLTAAGFSLELESGDTLRYAAPGTPVESWAGEAIALPGGARSALVIRIVGTLGEDFGAGCHWTTDLDCDASLSCGGPVDAWSRAGGVASATLSCGGACECTVSIEGSATDDTLDGTFSATSCRGETSGTVSLRRER